jgi:glycosyltransferase involved in cell wall biosynthesis
MKIGILGTRGIPNYYGGFEQFAEYLSLGLKERGHEVVVYNSSIHPYQEAEWKGVKIIHCKDWEDKIGTAGQFIYDFNCILNARKQNFDVLLQLGYTSNSIWSFLLPRKAIIVTNMDGLEWKRTKYNKKVRWFLKNAERWGVEGSDHLVADSIGIQDYLEKKYGVDSTFIAYGSNLFDTPNEKTIADYNVAPFSYHLLIARMEPENSIEVILDGYEKSSATKPFLVIGKVENSFGKYLVNKYRKNKNIHFLGGIYDIAVLNNLRYYSSYYFHGHTVGGTNPSLLEAMASSAFIVANKNPFNQSILEEDALYFSNEEEVAAILSTALGKEKREKGLENNRKKIEQRYTWENIIQAYEDLFLNLAG